jgi:hypothetical protein
MCICSRTCMHPCVRMHTYIKMYIPRWRTHVCICQHAHIHVHTYANAHKHTYAHMYTNARVHIVVIVTLRSDRQTDRRTDRQKDGKTDRLEDRQTYIFLRLVGLNIRGLQVGRGLRERVCQLSGGTLLPSRWYLTSLVRRFCLLSRV